MGRGELVWNWGFNLIVGEWLHWDLSTGGGRW